MARTGRPITLAGLWGPLAAQHGGVQGLAKLLGVPERSLRNWASNTRSMDAILAAKADELGGNLYAQVYLDPSNEDVHVASVTEGWVQWPAKRDGWKLRTAWKGDPRTLESGSLKEAIRHGWPLEVG